MVQLNVILSERNKLSLSTPTAYISKVKVSPICVDLLASRYAATSSTIN